MAQARKRASRMGVGWETQDCVDGLDGADGVDSAGGVEGSGDPGAISLIVDASQVWRGLALGTCHAGARMSANLRWTGTALSRPIGTYRSTARASGDVARQPTCPSRPLKPVARPRPCRGRVQPAAFTAAATKRRCTPAAPCGVLQAVPNSLDRSSSPAPPSLATQFLPGRFCWPLVPRRRRLLLSWTALSTIAPIV